MGYTVSVIPSKALATSATGEITPTLEVGDYEQVCISIENTATAATVVHVLVEASLGASASAASQANSWFAINTASYPYPSSVGATACVGFAISPNPFKYLRVSARMTVSAIAGILTTRLGGKNE